MEIIGKIPYVRLRTARRVLDKIHYTRKLSTSMRWYGTTARKSSSEKFRSALTKANRVLKTDVLGLTKFYNRYYTTKEYFSKNKTQDETTSQSCSLQPKQVLVLHLPPNSKVEKKIQQNSLSKKLPVVAAIIPANSISGKEFKGALEVTNITTVDFNELEAKKVMLVPVVIYESKEMKNININAQNEITQKTVLPSSKPEKELPDSSRITKIEDSNGREIYSFQLPSNLGTSEDNLPISSLKLVLQMEMPDVEKILTSYVKRKDKYESSSITTKNSDAIDFNRSINSLGSDIKVVKDNSNNANKMDDKIEDYIIPLDFKAEVKGVLGLNMKQLNVQSTEDLKSMDFNNLISAFAGNVASVAFQKSFMRSNVDQRTYSTTSKPPPTRDSPSELFQSYKTKMNSRGKYKYRLSKTDSTHRKSTESKQTSRNPRDEDVNLNVLSESNIKGKNLYESKVNSSVPLSKNIGQENTSQPDISSRGATTKKISDLERQIPSDTVKMPNTKIIKRYPREDAINSNVVSEHNAEVKSFNESTVNSSVPLSKNVGQDNIKQTDIPSVGATSQNKSDFEKQISSNNVKMPKTKTIKGFINNHSNVSTKKTEDLQRNSNKLNLTSEISEELGVNSKQSYKKALKGTIFNKKTSTETNSAKSGDAIYTSFLSGLFKKGGSKRSKDDEACYSKRQEAKNSNEKSEKPKVDCSMFDKKNNVENKSGEKKEAEDCSHKKAPEKKESKIDCSAFLKEEKGGSDKNKADPKSTKGECSGTDMKSEKKESKIDCSAFLKKKGGADKKPDQKDTKGVCSDTGKKGDEKKESKIECSAFLKEKDGADKQKPDQKDTKGNCSGTGKKGSEKKESKIDCSTFLKEQGGADKKEPDQKDTKGDCLGSGKKGSEKKESKIDCSAFLKEKDGADKQKPDQKDTKGNCSGTGKKGSEKKESKIDCSTFLKEQGGADKKKPDQKDTKGDCSGTGKKGDEKKESKIDCSGSGKKGDEKKESKIDCSAFLKEKGGADKKKLDQKDTKGDCSGSSKKGDEKKESKIDCSAFLKEKGGADKKKPDQKDTKGDCSGSGKKGDEKKESKIDCSAFLKEKGGADKKKSDQKDTKGDCSGTGKKGDEKKESKIDCSGSGKKGDGKKESKIDCSAFLKEKGGADKKKPDQKDTKGDCSGTGKKGDEKKESKIDCSGSGKKGDEKKESKIDCSAFLKEKGGADKKKSDQKDTKGDCSGTGKKSDEKKESKIDCSGSGKKGSEKKESKIDCSAFLKEKGGADKRKPDQKDTKGDCSGSSKKGDEKKESKIDCSAFLKEKGGADKKKPDQKDTKGDCSGTGKKGDEKKESKIDCSGSGKKGDGKKESKIDCSAFLKEKGGADKKKPDQKDTKGDCSGTGKKGDEKKESKIDCSGSGKKGNEKKESKIDCSAFLKEKGGADKKKSGQKDTKGDCSGTGKKGDEKKEPKIDCSGSGKKGNEKKESKIDCSTFLKEKEGADKKKPDQKDTKGDCSGSGKKGSEKKESKIDCSAFLKEQRGADKKDSDKKNSNKSNCSSNANKEGEGSFQTVKIALSKDVQIEITNAQISKENLNALQKALNNKSGSSSGNCGAPINCMSLVGYSGENEEPLELAKSGETFTLEISGPASLNIKPNEQNKPTNDKGNGLNNSPFKGGINKYFSTDARRVPSVRKLKRKIKFASVKTVELNKSNPSFNILNYDGIGSIAIDHPLQISPNSTVSDQRSMSSQGNTETKVTNKVVKIIDCREVCLDTTPIPEVGDYDVLLKVHSVGLSGSDLYMYENGANANNAVTLGHEASGIVEQVGKCVTNIKVGDHVAVEPGVPCGVCDFCKRGACNLCPETIFNGSLAQYSVHPSDFCHKLPEDCNLESGALMHPLALAVHACKKASISVQSNVLIIGACPLGLSSIICSKAMGASHVTIVDSMERNLNVAEKLRVDRAILVKEDITDKELAECVLQKLSRYGPPNVVINCSGCTNSLNTAIMTLRPGGICVLAGCQSECANFNILETLMKEIKIKSSFRSCNMFPTAIALLESCRADVSHLITHRFTLPEVKEAFETALDEENVGVVKVIVSCQQEEKTGDK